MSKYNTGTVAVTNGSASVTGTSTTWNTGGVVSVGDLFTITSSNVIYTVSAITSDTQLTISANYGGATESGKSYTISTSFTSNRTYPYIEKGDAEQAAILKQTITDIDEDISGMLGGTVDFTVASLSAGSVSVPSLTFDGDTNTGVYHIGADNIGITTGGSKILDINTTGLGILAAPSFPLQVYGKTVLSRADQSPSGTANAVFDDLTLGSTDTANTGMTIFGTGQTGVAFGDVASAVQGQIRYQHSTDTFEFLTNNNEVFTLGTANATISNGNLVIGTSGKGIDFSVTSDASGSDSELLDDYEEGDWTPQIYYANGTDQSNATNTSQTGRYTKVGNQVTCWFTLTWDITGTPANDNIGIKNLPYSSGANHTASDVGILSNSESVTDLVIYLGSSSSTVTFENSVQQGNYGDDFGAGTGHIVRGFFTYTTN